MKHLSYVFIFFVFLASFAASAQTTTTPSAGTGASVSPIKPTTTTVGRPVGTKPFPAPLKKNDTSSFVSDLQNILKDDSSVYPEGIVSGYYGELTEKAVKKLQRKYGLPETGIVDDDTQSIIFPTRTEITVIAPNGGESWSQLETRAILWNTSTGPFLKNGRTIIPGAEATVQPAPSRSAESTALRVMPEPPPVTPFFSRASIDLIRDSDPYFRHRIAIVGLYQSQYSWKIPASVREGNDYRIRVSVGGEIPCAYRIMEEAGGTTDIAPMPCPLSYPAYSASDVSDNPFSVIKSVPPSADIIEKMKRQALEIEQTIIQLLRQVQSFKSLLESL